MDETEQRLVMLIDAEPAQCRLITALASRDGWRVIVANDADSAIATLGTRQGVQLSAVILDRWVPGAIAGTIAHADAGAGDMPDGGSASGDGAAFAWSACDLIAELRRLRPVLPILMLTASASPVLAVAAMRAGATDYLIKPVSPDRLMQALRTATTREAPRAELQPLSEKMPGSPKFEAMIGASPAFRSALAIAAKAARSHASILIEGECGSGKELLAHAIHSASMRVKAPVRVVNIGTTAANSLESLLFGHEKGAFPGAFDRQIGVIQQCDGGTLVLDDVDRLPVTIQHRLLEALTRNDCRPVGAGHSFRVDVRYLFAANFRLRDLVEEGLFLPELFQTMAAVSLTLPPLRERSGDIAALARHFLGRIGEQPGIRALGITDNALALLAAYGWPGNVRQLQAVLFRAAVFCDGDALTPDDFPHLAESISHGTAVGTPAQRQDSSGVTLFTPDGNLRPLEDIEGDVIRLAIGHYRGRMTEVARRLGIGRSTLYRKLSDLGIDNAA